MTIPSALVTLVHTLASKTLHNGGTGALAHSVLITPFSWLSFVLHSFPAAYGTFESPSDVTICVFFGSSSFFLTSSSPFPSLYTDIRLLCVSLSGFILVSSLSLAVTRRRVILMRLLIHYDNIRSD